MAFKVMPNDSVMEFFKKDAARLKEKFNEQIDLPTETEIKFKSRRIRYYGISAENFKDHYTLGMMDIWKKACFLRSAGVKLICTNVTIIDNGPDGALYGGTARIEATFKKESV